MIAHRRAPHRRLGADHRPVGRGVAEPAFVLAVWNPLVLLYLTGGADNDALMLGLLVAGWVVATSRTGRRYPPG